MSGEIWNTVMCCTINLSEKFYVLYFHKNVKNHFLFSLCQVNWSPIFGTISGIKSPQPHAPNSYLEKSNIMQTFNFPFGNVYITRSLTEQP